MARPVADLRAAKTARQKKIAIGGAVLLVALLVIQVPRTLKMLNAKPPARATQATATVAPSAPTSTTSSAEAAPASPAPASGGQLVLTADLSPAPREGQLAVFTSSFKSKDPFAQLIKTCKNVDDPTGAQPVECPKASAATEPATGSTGIVPPGTTGTSATPDAAKRVSATISVNDVAEGVNVDADFPAASPLFHLVSLTATTAKISIAGGSLATGAQTVTLQQGKPLTLMNTADGTRYRLVLVATSTKAAAAPTTPLAVPTAPTTTTTTPTTTTATG